MFILMRINVRMAPRRTISGAILIAIMNRIVSSPMALLIVIMVIIHIIIPHI